MSHSASVLIYTSSAIPVVTLLEALTGIGWELNYHGDLFYLPLKDQENYDWQSSSIDLWPEVKTILSTKQRDQEVVGIGLSWKEEVTSGLFLFHPDHSISVLIGAHRIRISQADAFTDFSWYLSRLLPCLTSAGCIVESVACTDEL